VQRKTKILIVDDSPVYRNLLVSAVEKSGTCEVTGQAANGEQAISAVLQSKPELILLDLEMPRMDGFTFLRWLMVNVPLPVIVVSSKADVHSTFKALELGAADFLEKPASPERTTDLERELLRRIEVIAHIPVHKLIARTELFRDTRLGLNNSMAAPARQAPRTSLIKGVRAVMIGASTGGPTAIFSIIPTLPKEFPISIGIAQHMPAGFTRSFAERLNKLSKLEVCEAQGGERVVPGMVYIAPGGSHLNFEAKSGSVFTRLKPKERDDRYAPSVDELMISAASAFHGRVLGILLTGMGNDGVVGMQKVKSLGGITVAESEETAVVFGMPREAISAGTVDRVVPLNGIAQEIMDACS
jgi:two-component system chemotaxis response regulator CheB